MVTPSKCLGCCFGNRIRPQYGATTPEKIVRVSYGNNRINLMNHSACVILFFQVTVPVKLRKHLVYLWDVLLSFCPIKILEECNILFFCLDIIWKEGHLVN